jgi:hypothetical protein
MTGTRNDQNGDGRKVRRLSDAVRRVRIAEAERTDAFADLYDAEKARLSLLADELAGVFGEIPADDDYFLCQVGGGNPPRLWIEPTAHVTIGRDRRTYRFLKDTRLGRVVVHETAELASMADVITDYIAERVVERDRAQETDALLARMRLAILPATQAQRTPEPADAYPASALLSKPADPTPVPASAPAASASQGSTGLWMLIAFLFGIAAGIAGLIAYAWFKMGPV